ncbi:unnamed protein product [Diabrotica balteata]|uniref:Proton-coupled folate transporter n=1 Tax=Diabrotica balteata TaxID=107213 RepID=A0A9N9T4N7_DIABA|nr:unnamed protein product [Diabrotica balteata]
MYGAVPHTKMDEPTTTRYSNKFLHYFKYVTVEPTMLLYMMAFMTTNVAEQSFYVYKTCTINHGYNKTICDNINSPEYKNISKEVQASTAKFHVWNNLAGHVTPIILALFIGAWSDKRGRKLPLLIGLFGKLFFSLMIIVNTVQPSWPVEYVIFTATLPSALTGADVTIFATVFAYLVDVSSVSNRTMRVTILEVCYLASMPIGIAFGGVLAAAGPIVAPVIRSLVSKTVSSSEKGKAFAVLAVADNAVPLIAGTSYNALYYFVLPYNPGYVFFLTIATQIGVFLLATYIHSRTHRNEFEVEIPMPKPIVHSELDRLKEPNME